MAFDLGDADGRRVDVDLNHSVPYDGESVATAGRVSSSSSSVNWNPEGHHSNASTFTPPRPSRSATLPPPPPPPPQTLPLSPQPSVSAAPRPRPPPPQTLPLSPQPSVSAAPRRPPQPSSCAAPPPPPPQPLPLSPQASVSAAPPPPPQPSSYAAPPPRPPPPPRRQRQANTERGRRSDSVDLDSPAPQRRRVSDPNQPNPPSEREPLQLSSGHQEPQHEVPNKSRNNMEGHTPQSQFTLLQPSGSGAPPSSAPPAPTSAVPSSSSFKLNMTTGTNSSTGFQAVEAFLQDAQGSTDFPVRFICNCGDESNETMKAITNPKIKDKREVNCSCGKKYVIELKSKEFSLSCYDGKKKQKKIGFVTGSLASADDQIDDE